MKTIPLFLLFIFCTVCSIAQSKNAKSKSTKATLDCYYHGNNSLAKRRSFYPFNKAAKIELIGFRQSFDRLYNNDGYEVDFGGNKPMYSKLPDGTYELNKRRLVDSVELTAIAVDSLTDILYNYKYPQVRKSKDGTILIDEPVGCYNPRNAIIFKDANNKTIEYIEICFECEKDVLSSKRIKQLSYCWQFYSMLQQFFSDKGIKWGITPESRN